MPNDRAPAGSVERGASGRPQFARPLLREGAEQAQPGDSAVRIDVHARVRARRRSRQDEAVVGVGLEAGAREDLFQEVAIQVWRSVDAYR